MLYPFYDLYSHEPNTGELLSKILVYHFKHIVKKGRMFAIMICVSQPGIMGSKVLRNTSVPDKYNGYKRP